MAVRVAKALVELTLSDKQLISGLERAKKRIERFGRDVRISLLNISSYALRVSSAIMAPVTAAAYSLSHIGDGIAKAAKRAGMSAAEFDSFSYAIRLSGSSSEAFSRALMYMNRHIDKAMRGSEASRSLFDRMGLDYNVLDAMPDVTRRFLAIVQAINKLDEVTRDSVGQAIFGRNWHTMQVMVDEGLDWIKEQLQKSKELGIVITDEQAKSAERAADHWIRLKKVIQMLSFELGQVLMPILDDWHNLIMRLIPSVRALLSSNEDKIRVFIRVTSAVLSASIAFRLLARGLTVLYLPIRMVTSALLYLLPVLTTITRGVLVMTFNMVTALARELARLAVVIFGRLLLRALLIIKDLLFELAISLTSMSKISRVIFDLSFSAITAISNIGTSLAGAMASAVASLPALLMNIVGLVLSLGALVSVVAVVGSAIWGFVAGIVEMVRQGTFAARTLDMIKQSFKAFALTWDVLKLAVEVEDWDALFDILAEGFKFAWERFTDYAGHIMYIGMLKAARYAKKALYVPLFFALGPMFGVAAGEMIDQFLVPDTKIEKMRLDSEIKFIHDQKKKTEEGLKKLEDRMKEYEDQLLARKAAKDAAEAAMEALRRGAEIKPEKSRRDDIIKSIAESLRLNEPKISMLSRGSFGEMFSAGLAGAQQYNSLERLVDVNKSILNIEQKKLHIAEKMVQLVEHVALNPLGVFR